MEKTELTAFIHLRLKPAKKKEFETMIENNAYPEVAPDTVDVLRRLIDAYIDSSKNKSKKRK